MFKSGPFISSIWLSILVVIWCTIAICTCALAKQLSSSPRANMASLWYIKCILVGILGRKCEKFGIPKELINGHIRWRFSWHLEHSALISFNKGKCTKCRLFYLLRLPIYIISLIYAHQKKSFELSSKTAMIKSTLHNNQLCLTRRRIVFTNTNSWLLLTSFATRTGGNQRRNSYHDNDKLMILQVTFSSTFHNLYLPYWS